MDFVSTRGAKGVEAHEAILKGISNDGGLYVPSSFPQMTATDFKRLADMDYSARATFVLGSYLTDFNRQDLLDYATRASSRFEDNDPAPLVKIDDYFYIMELWHGPTLAFKDVALTTLPYLLTGSKKLAGEKNKVLILVATSGDTGKAALEGFKDVEGTEVVVIYPTDGVSDMQKRQMITSEGKNVHVLGIDGNFDDAQTAVKAFFRDKDAIKQLEELGYVLSSANSINFGRLVPQITYYISAYCDLLSGGEVKFGEPVNFAVPSGNFGNILALYYAKRMGLPVNKLIVGSNSNNILTDFFNTGKYDTHREFIKTMSPSMDILVSSNLERLLFELYNRDAKKVASLMESLNTKGEYKVDYSTLQENAPEFFAYCADEQETLDNINAFYEDYDYLIDPHTAVAVEAYNKYLLDTCDDGTPTVIVSTASPFKFVQSVYKAISDKTENDAIKAADKLCEMTGYELPQALAELKDKPILHSKTVTKDNIRQGILDFFGGNND